MGTDARRFMDAYIPPPGVSRYTGREIRSAVALGPRRALSALGWLAAAERRRGREPRAGAESRGLQPSGPYVSAMQHPAAHAIQIGGSSGPPCALNETSCRDARPVVACVHVRKSARAPRTNGWLHGVNRPLA